MFRRYLLGLIFLSSLFAPYCFGSEINLMIIHNYKAGLWTHEGTAGV